ncbi:hypothetical protein H3C70_03575 [Patescibacteria group bacterium]|nr:hypothetical protein [Patescibacteria group bacterium]
MENTLPKHTPPSAPYSEMRNIRASLQDESPRKPSRIWMVLGGAAIVLLIIAAVIQVLTPKKVTIPETSFVTTNVNDTLPHITDVSYTGPTADFPTQFPIFSSRQLFSEGQVVSDISAKYGLLKPDPEANYWINGDLGLVHDQTTGSYTLILKDPSNEALPVVDPTRAEEVAHSFLEEVFPEIPLRPMMDAASYYIMSSEPDNTVTASEATAVVIPYTPEIETEYPVIYEKSFQPAFAVTVDGENTIRVLQFFPLFQQFTKVDEQAPISIDQALEQIKQGVASIISATIVDYNRVPISDLTKAEFTSVTIEYRLDPTSQLLYPFYHFTGKGTNSRNVNAEIDVITPAVNIARRNR